MRGETKGSFIDSISERDAMAILRILVREDAVLERRIEAILKEDLSEFDPEDVAEDLYYELNRLEAEEVWDRAGKTRHGYVDPADAAHEMFEVVLEPFVEEMLKYLKISMDEEAKNCGIGILMGIRKFQTESTTEYKNWAGDSPGIHFDDILELWRKEQKHLEYVDALEQFVKEMVTERE